jgi:hypothetical protein
LFHFAANVSNNKKYNSKTKAKKSTSDPISRTSSNQSGQTPDMVRKMHSVTWEAEPNLLAPLMIKKISVLFDQSFTQKKEDSQQAVFDA